MLIRSLLFLAGLLLNPSAFAATYYVSPGGHGDTPNDSGSLAAAQNILTPWRTIGHATAAAIVPGDIILVRGGNYTTEGQIIFSHSGSAGNPITLQNYPSENPRVQWDPLSAGSSTLGTNRIYMSLGSPFTTPISDITIDGIDLSGGYEGVKFEAALRILIKRCKFHGFTNNGISPSTNGGTNSVTLTQNMIYSNGDFNQSQCAGQGSLCNQFHGLYIVGQNWIITNNLIFDNLAYGIQADAATLSASPNQALYGGFSGLIANNVLAYQKNRAAIVFWANTAQFGPVTVENNIFLENSQNYGSSAQVLAFTGGSGYTGNVVNTNVWFGTGNSTAFQASATPSGVTIGSNINQNPVFLNAPSTIPPSPDFHITPTPPSPAHGVGLNLSATPALLVDFDGNARPGAGGGPWDIGAYELGTSTDTTPPSAPSNLVVASSNKYNTLNLTWTAATDNVAVQDYIVERCDGAGCSAFFAVAFVAGLAFSEFNLLTNTSYSYQVKARDTSNNIGSYTSVATAVTTSAAFHYGLNLRRVAWTPRFHLGGLPWSEF